MGDGAFVCHTASPGPSLEGLHKMTWFQEWKGDLVVEGNRKDLSCNLSQGFGFSVSDRSYHPGHGTAAWIIEGCNHNNQVIIKMITPGAGSDHSAFCSELCGLLCILVTLTHIPLETSQPQCHVACDGKSVLLRIQSRYVPNPKEPHADLILACQHWIQHCPYQLEWAHVKGQQDGKMITALHRDAWLNIEADALAQKYLDNTKQEVGPLTYRIPGSQWVCYIKQQCVVKQLSECLWEQINGLEAIKYWKRRQNYSKAIWESIDWDALATAYKEVSSAKHWWASKWASGHFSHGKNMTCWQFWSSAACPHCGHDLEDKVYMIQCPDPEVEKVWEASIKQLRV